MTAEHHSPSHIDDPVILGGGLCGLILASCWAERFQNALHANGSRRSIWVIEAPQDHTAPAMRATDQQRPANWLRLLGSADDWQHRTTRQRGLADRQLGWPRGRGLGGSGRINAMIWTPPHASDAAAMARAGLDEQRWFEAVGRAESLVAPEQPRWLSQNSHDFLATQPDEQARPCGDLGWQLTPYRRLNRHSRRWTAEALIRPRHGSDGEPWVRIVRAAVHSIHLKNDRVASIELIAGGERRTVEIGPRGRVVSSLGAIGTPAMLLRSGIGGAALPEDVRRQRNCPGVGDQLHDHLIMPVVFRTRASAMPAGDWSMAELAAWQHLGTGPVASNIAECGGWSSDNRCQLHVTPTDYLRYPATGDRWGEAAMTIGVHLTRPLSRGTLRVGTSGADRWGIVIDPNYLGEASDRDGLVQAVRAVRAIAARPPLCDTILDEVIPGRRRDRDTQITSAIERFAQTLYHPGGTCSLGRVVGPDFRLDHLENLHVVDASLLPEPTHGNPTGVLAALAQYAAETID